MEVLKKLKLYPSILLLTTLPIIAGCGLSRSSTNHLPDLKLAAQSSQATAQQNGGFVTLVRLAKDIRSLDSSSSLLGFLPLRSQKAQKQLIIDTTSGKLIVKQNDQVLEEVELDLKEKLDKGSYKIVHKQRAPLWYAPDSYFANRHLSVPAEGDSARFRRGALGDFAMFLDNDTPLYSSPVETNEVMGINLGEDLMKKIYYTLEIGSVVEIR